GMTLVIAVANINLAILGLGGRLTYYSPSRYTLLREVMSNDLWIWLHALGALLIFGALLAHRHHVAALGFSAGVMGAWSFFTLLWGMSATAPVSLVGPILGGALTTMAYLLCASWARTEHGL
ncbi:MAG: hypothetical protein ACOH10_12850, partial [Rhodoglobus sp.]